MLITTAAKFSNSVPATVEHRAQLTINVLGATFDTGNLGVSALAEGTIRAILHRFPEAKLFLLDYGRTGLTQSFQLGDREINLPFVNMRFSKRFWLPNSIAVLLLLALVARLVPSWELRRRLLARNPWLQRIQEANCFVSIAGGDSFSDIYGLGRLLYVSLPQILALLLGKRLILLPQTIGPFRRRIAKMIARYILIRADRVYCRDYTGVEELQSCFGPSVPKGKVKFCPDVGFVVDSAAPASLKIAGLGAEPWLGRPLVGLNASGLLAMGGYTRKNMFGLRANYMQLVYSLIEFFVEKQNTKVLLVPHVFGREGESDSIICEKIYQQLKEKYPGQLGLVCGSYKVGEIKYIIGQCDFFVGSRMHACIAALSQNVAAVAVAYSDKFIGVMRSIGIGSLVVDARELLPNQILDRVEEAFQQKASLRRQLEQVIPQVKETVLQLFADLDLLVGSQGPQRSSETGW